MSHAARARALRDEYQRETGEWPAYPRSRVALQELRERLDNIIQVREAEIEAAEMFEPDLDVTVPFPVQLPAVEWVELLADAKDEFDVDCILLYVEGRNRRS